MEYVLIIFIYAGALTSSDSVAINKVAGFATKELCQKAGKEAIKEFTNIGFKSGNSAVKFVCAKIK